MFTPVFFYFILNFGWTNIYCAHLSGYNYEDFKILGGLIKLILLFLTICGGGILVFYLLKKYVLAFQNKYVQAAYIFLLWVIIFFPQLRVTIQNHNNSPLVSSLCDKTMSTGILVKSDNLTFPEYEYLQSKLSLLPDISSLADSIGIDYYHDGFLPDFSLKIHFRVPINDQSKADEKHWFEKSRDGKFKWIEFRDGEK